VCTSSRFQLLRHGSAVCLLLFIVISFYSLSLLITQLYYKNYMVNGIGGEISASLSVGSTNLCDPDHLL
jgi:hypothetical protein